MVTTFKKHDNAQVANALNRETAQCLLPKISTKHELNSYENRLRLQNADDFWKKKEQSAQVLEEMRRQAHADMIANNLYINKQKQNKKQKTKKQNKNIITHTFLPAIIMSIASNLPSISAMSLTQYDCPKIDSSDYMIFHERLCYTGYTRSTGYYHVKFGEFVNTSYLGYICSEIDHYLDILIRYLPVVIYFLPYFRGKRHIQLLIQSMFWSCVNEILTAPVRYPDFFFLMFVFCNFSRQYFMFSHLCGLTFFERSLNRHNKCLRNREPKRNYNRRSNSTSYSNIQSSISEESFDEFEVTYQHTYSISSIYTKDYSKYKPSRQEKRNKPRNTKHSIVGLTKKISNSQIQSDESSSPFDFVRKQLRDKFDGNTEHEFIIHSVEVIYFTAQFLQRAETKQDVFLAFANLTKHYLPKRAICTPKNLQKINNLLKNLFKVEEIQSSSSDLILTFRNLLTDYASAKKSPLFKKVYRLFSYSIALNLFERMGIPLKYTGYTLLEKEILQKKYHMGPDFIFSLLDTVSFVAERCIQCWKKGGVEPLFHAPSTYVEWFEFALDLKNRARLLHDPTLAETSEAEFLRDLDSAIEKGESIHKYASRLTDFDRRTVGERLNDLKMIKSEILCLRFANESRQVPYSVLVFGESGVGKSTIKDILYYLFCKARNLPNGDEYKYVRNPVSEFWDGFRSNMHSLFLDDVAYLHPNKAPNGDQSCLEFIQVINAVPFVPNQAALEHKGRTPFRGQLVVATTNTKDLNAHYYFSHPSAIQRRFPYIIIPTPKPEYTTDGMLDSSKVPPPTQGSYPDLWTFSVHKVRTVSISSPQKKAEIVKPDELQNMNQAQFFQWYVESIKTHFSNQDKMSNSIQMMADVKSCINCSLPLTMCKCSLQSLEALSSMATIFDFFFKCSYAWKLRNWYNRMFRQAAETHAYYQDLGERVQRDLNTPINLVKLVTAITSFYISYKLWQKIFKTVLQSSEGISPEGKEERENPWYKNDFQLTDFDVSRQTTSWKSLTDQQVIDKLSTNIMSFKQAFKSNGKNFVKDGVAIALGGHKIMVNLHTLKLDEDILNIRLIRQSSCNGVTTNVAFAMSKCDVMVFQDHDVAILTVPHLPPFKDITQLFPNDSFNGSGKGLIISRGDDGKICQNSFIRAKRENLVDFSHFKDLIGKSLVHDSYVTQVKVPTESGQCGSPYLMQTPQGPVLLGIHVAGKGAKAESLFFSQTLINQFLGREERIVPDAPKLSAQSKQREVGELSKKSVFRYIDHGSATVYGSFTGFKIAPKSRVEQTPMNAFLQEKGYSTKYTAPVMSGWKPWRIAALDLVNPVTDIDMSSLKYVTEQFAQTILKELAPEEIKLLNVYDDFTALNGAAGVTYVDKMNRNTSAGNPWKKSKKYFLTAIAPRGENLEPVEASDEIMDRMKEIIDNYKNGKRAHPNFCAHLKDEPVTHKKREMGKTRVFSGAPFDWSLVVRKYYLSMIRVIQRNKFIFEAAPGTICQSSEWGDIYKYLATFGENQIVAGDYKAYDKRMPPAFIKAAFHVMITICMSSKNFDEEDILIMKGIAEDTAYPLTDFNGDLVEFYGSNPSGHPLTVIINSLVNSLYMRYVYYMLNPNDEVETFRQNVKLMTYGDDNIMGVSKETPWFNHTTIQETLGRMGITYTMPDKTSESVPYIDISQASFLKRTWRFDEELQEYLCPLEHESIEKSLMVWTRSKTICWEEQVIAVVSSAIQEYFFYGKQTYNKRLLLLKDMISDLGIEEYETFDKEGNSLTFPKYETLVERFKKAGH
jgi:hypothetical protein